MPIEGGAIPTAATTTTTADDIGKGRSLLLLALLILAAGLVVNPWIGGRAGRVRGIAFGVSVLGVLALFAGFGMAVTGYWSGMLMSGRNTYSLARAQAAAWTWIVLSALTAAVVCNLWDIGGGAAVALNVSVPENLLVMLGISGASLAASPAALAMRTRTTPDMAKKEEARMRLDEPSIGTTGQVITRADPSRASWLDMIQGDEVANAGMVDLAKVQHLLISTMLVGGYALLVARALVSTPAAVPIAGLPDFSAGFAWLAGISSGAYLAYRAAPKSAAGPDTVSG